MTFKEFCEYIINGQIFFDIPFYPDEADYTELGRYIWPSRWDKLTSLAEKALRDMEQESNLNWRMNMKKSFEQIIATKSFECCTIEIAGWHSPQPVSILLRFPVRGAHCDDEEVEIALDELDSFIEFLQDCKTAMLVTKES